MYVVMMVSRGRYVPPWAVLVLPVLAGTSGIHHRDGSSSSQSDGIEPSHRLQPMPRSRQITHQPEQNTPFGRPDGAP